MIHHRIRDEVFRVGERFRQLWLRRALTLVWLAAAMAGLSLIGAWLATGWRSELSAPLVAGAAVAAALAVVILGRKVGRDDRWVARRIESRYPELNASLLAALEQRPDLPDGRFGFLQDALFTGVMGHARRASWLQAVPDRRLSQALAGNLLGLSALAVVLVALGRVPGSSGSGIEQVGAPGTGAGLTPSYEVKVDPGDVELERGSSLLIVARFARDVPPEATLVLRTASGGERSLRMSRSLDDPLFGARLESVTEDLEYVVEFAGERSPSFRATVFQFPEVARSDAHLVFPAFTGLEPKTIEDTRRVSSVAGTELTWLLRLNKAVSRAELLDEGGASIRLDAGEEEMTVRSPVILLQAPARYRVRLVDDRGRENRDPHELSVQVNPNAPADLKLVRPRGDVKVSPLEELGLEAKVRDDYGLLEYGITYTLAGQAPKNIVLSNGVPGRDAREARHLLDFEALQAKPDQLVSYYFWADDAGPGGEPRRAFSDMFFAEVRPFDEVFRQGQDPPEGDAQERQREREAAGEAGGNAGDAEDLAEIQKEIVSGTWNLMRGAPRRGVEGAGADLARDAGLLRDSQESALEQASGLAERLENEASRADIEAVLKAMGTALERLREAAAGPSAAPLEPALAAEQSAYEGLLRLRAREFEVVRGNQAGSSRGSRGGQARSRRQLSELELSSSRNRYESQRSAPRERNERPEEAEDRQVSSRLRDLARRQADVNERLKDLDAALSEAREKNDREEIERQLKRLRDEERRILGDTDELTERMDRPENQERMGDARDQLRETREDVRRASEALEEGRVSQAVAEGTRAARDLEDLREDFRRRTARQFVEEMQELREGAERLARNEEDLSSRLGDLDREEKRSLRGSGERDQVEEGLARQRQELEDMLQRMQKTVEEAEKPEPLLAEKLYDVVRGARHSRVPEALDAARTALERGLASEASRAERQARDGIDKFKAGVDEAAETVLGDETEALRRAGEEIERLSEDVESEAARAGEAGGEERGGAQSGRREPGAEAARGEPREQGQEGSGEGNPQGGRPAGTGERVAAGEGGARGERAAEAAPAGRGRAGGEEMPPGDESGERGGARSLRGRQEGRGGPQGGEGGERLGGPRPAGDPGSRGGEREIAPIAGEGFRGWSDRLRDVEEMIDDPDLRAEAARIRDRARDVREEVRHAKAPNWDIVRVSIVEPLNELRRRVAEEIIRRAPDGSLVPIDRDPVPPKYADSVREYYEKLGSGK